MMTRLCVIGALVLSLSLPLATLSAGGDEEVQKKVDAIRKQLEELRKQEKALLEAERDLLKSKLDREQEKQRKEAERREREERERQAKEVAEKKKHYAKVEIRGKLGKASSGFPNQQTHSWHLAINELNWTLTFDDKNNELLALAEKHAGKGVVITGRVVTTKVFRTYTPYTMPPMQWPQPPNPFPPMTPQPWPGWQPYPMQPWGEVAPTLIVESITLAKD